MKKQILLILTLTIFYNYSTFSQDKIKADIKTMLFLGRIPEKTKSNTLSDNLLRVLYYNIQSNNSQKIGYMNKKGKILIKPKYSMCSDFYGNYANIIRDSIFGYINKEGEEVLLKQYDTTFFYYGDTGVAKKNGKYGLINRKGDSLTGFNYTMIDFFGFNYFKGHTEDRKSQILDEKGNIIFNKNLVFNIRSDYFESESVFVYQEIIEGKELKGLVNLDGKIILKPTYQEIYFIDDKDYYVVKHENKWGFINKSGNEAIPLIYDEVSFNINDDLIPVKKKDKWGYVNRKNEVEIPFIYDKAYAFLEDLAFVKKGNYYNCIDKHNKIKVNTDLKTTDFPFFVNSLALFKKENKYGFLNKKGKIKIPAMYDLAYPFINGLAYVELNGKVGYINTKGNEVIPIKYGQLWFESEGIIRFVE